MRLHTRPTLPAALAVFVLALILGSVASAQELLQPKITDRKYPQGTWCPLPFDLEFTPISTTVIIKFSTNVWYQDDSDQSFHFTDQYLDNIYVSPQSVYTTNLGTYSDDCYFPHPDNHLSSVFYFENAGDQPLDETFAADPSARWDIDHGAHWENSPGGPAGGGDDTRANGMLGLGEDTQGTGENASTQVSVEGLHAGQPYVLTGWWNVNDLLPGKVELTVTIYTDAATPVMKKTWGSVKQLYRGTDRVSD